MHTLALDAQGLYNNMSGQQMGITSGSCMQMRSLCWLLQQLSGCVFPQWRFSVNSSPVVLCAGESLKGLVVEGVAGGSPVPFLGHSQLVMFLYLKGHEPPPFQELRTVF